MKDVVSLLKKPKTFGSQFKKPPLVRSDILSVRKKSNLLVINIIFITVKPGQAYPLPRPQRFR